MVVLLLRHFDTSPFFQYPWLVIISVVIPTYLEKGNIEKLIISLELELSKLNHKFSVVICDDKSPDGTGEIVEKLISNHKNLFLVSGSKEGYGKAIARGVKYAIEKLQSEVVVSMDADFSHDPKEVVKLIKAVEAGADFVIGSRYVSGGKISAKWSNFRRLNSLWGNRFARYLVGIANVQDCTSGFRAIKSTYLKKIKPESIDEKGYSFLVRVLYEAKKLGAKVVEVPINFADRKSGETKLGVWDIIEFIVMSLKISLTRLLRLN